MYDWKWYNKSLLQFLSFCFYKEGLGLSVVDQRQSFSSEIEQLRWFLLPIEALEILIGYVPDKLPKMPFAPRQYLTTISDPQQLYRHYSTI